MTRSHSNIEDVVIEDAEDVELSNVEDVFVEPGAVSGETVISDAEDVRVVSDDGEYRSVYRDQVIDADEDVVVENAEDVRVKSGSVSGDLVIDGDGRYGAAGDVWIASPSDVEVETVQDVYVESNAVAGDVAADSPEDVSLSGDGAVAGDVETDEITDSAALTVTDTEDVHVDSGGIKGNLTVAGADGIAESSSQSDDSPQEMTQSLTPDVTFDATAEARGASTDVGEVESGLQITGDSSSIAASIADDEITLHIAGNYNTINLFGVDETVRVYYEGDSNTLKTAPDVTVEMVESRGTGLSKQSDERFALDEALSGMEPEEIIEQTRQEALDDLGLVGTAVVNYQEPASDEKERCEYCTRAADTIIERVSVKVVRVFGLTWEYKEVARSDECEYCTLHVDYSDLDEGDRLDI